MLSSFLVSVSILDFCTDLDPLHWFEQAVDSYGQRFIFTTRSLTGHRKKNCHRPPQKLTNCKFAIYIANLFFSEV